MSWPNVWSCRVTWCEGEHPYVPALFWVLAASGFVEFSLQPSCPWPSQHLVGTINELRMWFWLFTIIAVLAASLYLHKNYDVFRSLLKQKAAVPQKRKTQPLILSNVTPSRRTIPKIQIQPPTPQAGMFLLSPYAVLRIHCLISKMW